MADGQSKFLARHVISVLNGGKAVAYEPWTKGSLYLLFSCAFLVLFWGGERGFVMWLV